jgi:two-component system chemotaxis response regulator CheY
MPDTRALIMDDSSVMRKILARALRLAGIEQLIVSEAGNGEEALELLAESHIDLIVCDINIPCMDGLEFLRQIQERHPGIPVVVVTTESGAAYVKGAIRAGARAYLRKPFTADQIKDCVLPLLEGSAA